MAIILTDVDIARLLTEPKTVPVDYQSRLQPRPKAGHKERDLDVLGQNGSEFQIIVRQSSFNPLDFSVILGYAVPKSSVLFRLRRYNGRSHQHFYDFHVHTATERYQDAGYAEEHFAEVTDRYVDLNGAIQCLINDCAFELPPGTQGYFL